MVGKECVAIACDLRLGNQALTVACNFEKVRFAFPSIISELPTNEAEGESRCSQRQIEHTLDYRDWRVIRLPSRTS